MYLGVITEEVEPIGDFPSVNPATIPILYKSLGTSDSPTDIVPLFVAFLPYEYTPIFP